MNVRLSSLLKVIYSLLDFMETNYKWYIYLIQLSYQNINTCLYLFIFLNVFARARHRVIKNKL